MISANGLRKVYGDTVAVHDVDFTVEPGHVTGFLGPNGAGKSTTMRMIMGLDHPSAGHVTVSGVNYAELSAPLREVGALLEAKAIHPGRSAYQHLNWLAVSNAIDRRRVDEVLDIVGLTEVAGQRAGRFSLGMGQRLGIAAALLGNPGVLLFDEPVNGLDPEGILWVRNLMKSLAAEGRTVLVSSHLMSEMALTADHLIVIGRGRILADQPTSSFIAENSASHVRVRSPQLGDFTERMRSAGWDVATPDRDESTVLVHGATADQVGDLAGRSGTFVHELTPVHASLEDAFMRMTADSVQYHAWSGEPDAPGTDSLQAHERTAAETTGAGA